MVLVKRARSPSSSALVQEGPPKTPRRSFYPFQRLTTTASTLIPTTNTIETASIINLCPARIFATFPYLPSGHEPDKDSSGDFDDEDSGNAHELLTDLNRNIYDEEILEVLRTHLNDIIPPEAWEVELTWRERGILETQRDAIGEDGNRATGLSGYEDWFFSGSDYEFLTNSYGFFPRCAKNYVCLP